MQWVVWWDSHCMHVCTAVQMPVKSGFRGTLYLAKEVVDGLRMEEHPTDPDDSEVQTAAQNNRVVESGGRRFVAYTVKLPSEQLAALQSIWLELKRLYGTNSPDKSGMIQLAIDDWLKRWEGPERQKLLQELLEIRQDTRRRQYKKNP